MADPPLPEARIGYITGWDIVIIASGDWDEVSGEGDPGFSEDAQYYYVREESDEKWTALLFNLDNDEWKLKVTNQEATRTLDFFGFPWENALKPLHPTGDTDLDDNIGFGTFGAGVAKRTEYHPNNGSFMFAEGSFPSGLVSYPGGYFAPFVIVADDDYARIVYATDWPPVKLQPNLRKNGAHIFFMDIALAEGESASRSIVVKTVESSGAGDIPWYNAALEYRNWLRGKMTTAGTYPVEYNDWMEESQGFLNMPLMNVPSANLAAGYVYDKWEAVRDDLNFVLCWGQMSSHNGGCCDLNQSMNSRYTATDAFGTGKDIFTFVNAVQSYGQHIGFYSRSQDYANTLTATNQEWWADWLDTQRETWGADAYYLDVLGATYHGDPSTIVDRFSQTWSVNSGTNSLGFDGVTTDAGPDSVIEGVVDIYPAAYLVSGFLGVDDYHVSGGVTYETHTGGPDFTLANLQSDTSTSYFSPSQAIFFPRLATVVLNDRIFFNGDSNGGYSMLRDRNYRNTLGTPDDYYNFWIERNCFLLGHRFDIQHEVLMDYSTPNPVFYEILSLRDDHYWWKRKMRYQDEDGLTNVDGSLRVRRFEDQNGASVFAVEWWGFDAGNIPSPLPTFTYDSITYDAPEAAFGIVETAWNYDDTSPCDSNSNGIPDYAESSDCLYDIWTDGVVDSYDEGLITWWITSCGPPNYLSLFDFNCDGCIDYDDQALITARIGGSCP
ncbi:MAG: hypothetical protein H6818_18045 [Phycisphaerales bacterium]|nr:hypothetical protein [Phycisphaerales bacterium]